MVRIIGKDIIKGVNDSNGLPTFTEILLQQIRLLVK
jgi:hypothetical protein